MKPVRKTLDTVFRYRGYHGCPSRCRIRVYEAEGDISVPSVLVATEIDDNPGTSVTNRIEVIATEVYRLLERPEAGLRVIEHYTSNAIAPERFALVTMEREAGKTFSTPRWKHLSLVQVEEIIGGRS